MLSNNQMCRTFKVHKEFKEADVSWICHLVEELLAAGTLLLLLLLPRRLAKPGPARAPRPPDIQKENIHHYSPESMMHWHVY